MLQAIAKIAAANPSNPSSAPQVFAAAEAGVAEAAEAAAVAGVPIEDPEVSAVADAVLDSEVRYVSISRLRNIITWCNRSPGRHT